MSAKTRFISGSMLAVIAFGLLTPSLAIAGDVKSAQVGGMLASIFGGLTGGGPLHEMFASFNSVILFFGSLVISYTVMMSIMNTAHDGEMMGKKLSSVWIPLRSAGSIALLLPTAGGFSAIQVIVLSLAAFGSDMGSAVWQNAIPVFQSQAPGIGDLIPASTKISGSDIVPLALSIADAVRCTSEHDRKYNLANADATNARNAEIAGLNVAADSVGAAVTDDSASITKAVVDGNYGGLSSIQYNADSINFGYPAAPAGCKAIKLLPATEDMSPAQLSALQIHNAATITMVQAIAALAYSDEGGKDIFDKNIATTTTTAINQYVSTFNAGYNASAGLKTQMSDFVAGLGSENWLAAGTVYYQAGASATAAKDSAKNIPQASAGTVRDTGASSSVGDAYASIKNSIAAAYEGSKLESVVNGMGDMLTIGKDLLTGNLDGLNARLTAKFAGGIDKATGLAKAGSSGLNPIMAMKQIGDEMLDTGLALWSVMTGLFVLVGVGTTNAAAATVGGVGAFGAAFIAVGGLVFGLLSVMIGLGFSLAIYLPMVPYILWIAAVIGWLIFTFEAVLAAPILALGLAHPEGHDAFGKSEVGIMMLASLVFRPSLLVISFAGAMLISSAVAGFVNSTYFALAGNLQSAAHTFTGIVSSLGFLGIYLAVMTQVINKSFSMIHVVPDKIMTWVGGHATGHADGSAEHQTNAAVAGGVAGGAAGMAGAGKSAMSQRKGKKEDNEAAPKDSDLLK